MKKIIIYGTMMVFLVGVALAISMSLDVPSQANKGSTFSLELDAMGSSGSYGVLYTIDIAGGCTSATGNTQINNGFLAESDTTETVSIIAPSTAGTCDFSGNYQFADGTGTYPEEQFTAQSTSIVEGGAPVNGDGMGNMQWILLGGAALVVFMMMRK